MIGRTLIIGGGEIDYEFTADYLSKQKFDTVVCADSGLDAADRLGLNVNFLMGDFDSVEKETLSKFLELDCQGDNTKYIKYPKEKDYTDMHLVLEWTTGRKPSEIVILGATGRRLDHFIANINILMLPLENNIPAYIIDKYNKICLADREHRISKENLWGKYISICPFTDKVTDVCLHGFKYPLTGETLRTGGSRTVSNELADGADEAIISLGEGILIVIESKDR
ncbi:MAG TPA: thiamine diphosphokinase [Lachnospiraceae bacterium]|nr:thiamine diphosphokinase [Lachnospiraceae bacterium]